MNDINKQAEGFITLHGRLEHADPFAEPWFNRPAGSPGIYDATVAGVHFTVAVNSKALCALFHEYKPFVFVHLIYKDSKLCFVHMHKDTVAEHFVTGNMHNDEEKKKGSKK